MNVPASIGRLNATLPLAELTLTDVALRLTLRGFLRHFARERVASFDDIEAVQTVATAFRGSGVRFRVRGDGTWYFWTTHLDAVISALVERGADITPGRPKLPLLYSKEWD